MIALTAQPRKALCKYGRNPRRNARQGQEISSHAIVRGILLLPYFCQPPAPLGCDNITLRWPGPFGSGFLSPQPPGAVGIGPVRRGEIPNSGQRKLVLFRFWGLR